MRSTPNFAKLTQTLKGKMINKPSGQLSGHSVGTPIENTVYDEFRLIHKENSYKQYEFLNAMFSSKISKNLAQDTQKVFENKPACFLLLRGESAMKKFSLDNPFTEKQNDTADIIYFNGDTVVFIDVKSKNLNKTAQPPNIISGYKLAKLCDIMLNEENFESVRIFYIVISWNTTENHIKFKDISTIDLFKCQPSDLYINFTAGTQIQVDFTKMTTNYALDTRAWCLDYIRHYVSMAKQRIEYFREEYIKPFEKWLS